MFIDTHSHLYSGKFSEDRAAMMDRIRAAGVDLAVMPAVDTKSHAAMVELEADYPDLTLAMIGLHPCSVGENVAEELAAVEDYLDRRAWVAIGEIGMDLYWDTTFREQQEMAFRRQCGWAIDRGLPICIHAREAIDELLAIIDDIDDERLRGVFHCFTGSVGQAERAVGRGFHLGIGGVATFKNGGLEPVLRQLPRRAVVLETDAPYLAPVPKRGRRNETSFLPFVAGKVAEVWDVSVEEVARITTANAWQLFDLDRFARPEYGWVARRRDAMVRGGERPG